MSFRNFLAASGIAVVATSCAGAGSPRDNAHAPGAVGMPFNHARAYGLPEEIVAQGQEVLALVGKNELQNVAFHVAQVQRAEIGAESLRRTAAHEAALETSDPSRILNFSSQAKTLTPIRIDVAANNGGWIEEEDVYRHAYSGMTCQKAMIMLIAIDDDTSNLALVPLGGIQVYDENGLDTSCSYQSELLGIYITLYASKWPDVTLEDHYAAALNDIVNQLPIASGAMTMTADSKTEDGQATSIQGDTKAAAFILEPINGKTLKTILWLNKTGDWHVKARVTYVMPEDKGDTQIFSTELFAAIAYSSKLSEVDKHINSGALTQVSF